VATSVGAALALAPLAALASAGVYLLLYAVFRISSVGSLVAISTFPLALYLTGDRERAHYLFAAIMAVLVIARHRDNLRRLRRGEELKS
jgi:glycerol-3-phosphate acyltransferase PlsY